MSDVQGEVQVAVEKKVPKVTLKVEHAEGNVAKFHYKFAHGSEHEVVLDPSHPLYHDLAVHGLKQILGDTVSTKKTSEEGEEHFAKRVAAFESGEWNVKGGSGESAPTGGLLARALANLYGQDISTVQNYLQGLGANADGVVDEKERAKIHAALRADETVAAEIERIRPPKKEKKVSEAAASKAAAALAGLAK